MQEILLTTAFFAVVFFLTFNYSRIFSKKIFQEPRSEESRNIFLIIVIIIVTSSLIYLAVDFSVTFDDNIYIFTSNLLFVLSPALTIFISLLTTVIQKSRSKPIFFSKDQGLLIKRLKKYNNSPSRDLIRKLFHIILFLGMSIAFFEGYYWMHDIISRMDPRPFSMVHAITWFWGASGGPYVFFDPEYLGVANIIIIMIFYIQFILYSIMEFCRFSRKFDFPLQGTLSKALRNKEAYTFASYLYFSAGFLFAAFFLPPLFLLGIFGMSCFGDTLAAQIGMRWGKHKISFNPDKSWEGLIAGTITSYFCAIFFMGAIWSIVAAITFLIVDALTSKIIKLSDNLAFPIFAVFSFILFSFSGIPVSPLITIPVL
ncbi:MAG: hypothetical protein ACTSVI_17510 [Promethearchaeota archaeon]